MLQRVSLREDIKVLLCIPKVNGVDAVSSLQVPVQPHALLYLDVFTHLDGFVGQEHEHALRATAPEPLNHGGSFYFFVGLIDLFYSLVDLREGV